jgi:hypothetical protein
VQDLDAGVPRPISPEGVTRRYRAGISPSGKKIAALDPEGKPVIYDVAGGSASPIPGVQEGDEPIQWTPDGKKRLAGAHQDPESRFYRQFGTGHVNSSKRFSRSIPAACSTMRLRTSPATSRATFTAIRA